MQIKHQLLKKLCLAHGVMGDEAEVLNLIKKILKQKKIKFYHVGPYGDIICGQLVSAKLMISAHVDEIGFMVDKVNNDGTFQVRNLGWVKPHMLNETTVYIKNNKNQHIKGRAFGKVPLLSGEVKSFKDIFIDLGTTAGIKKGAIGNFVKDYWYTASTLFAGALDNRLGVYLLLKLMDRYPKLLEQMMFAFTTGEEDDFQGVKYVTRKFKPEYALLVDMFPIHQKFGPKDTLIKERKGPIILYRGSHYKLKKEWREIIKNLQIKAQKAEIETDPIELETEAIERNKVTKAMSIYFPVRGYHKGVYSLKLKDYQVNYHNIEKIVKFFLQAK